MPMRRFERIAPAQFLVGGLAVVFVACVLIKHAQAQFVNPPPPPPPPVFNPSTPNTVPQPSYTPLSPATPSTVPETPSTVPETPSTVPETPSTIPPSVAKSPANRRLPHTAHSHRRVARAGSTYYRAGPIILGPPPVAYSYYYSGFGYGYGYGYGCAWRRSWDRYWFRTSPCS